jgi:hypothetical protein
LRITVETLSGKQKINAEQTLDLLRAINSYRSYPDKKILFQVYPCLLGQEPYVDKLWKHFEGLGVDRLNELAIETIHELTLNEGN